MRFDEYYNKFGLKEYPFNTFTTEDEKERAELFVEPIDYSLIKDAFKNSRTIIMAGNRGTGKTAIVYDLMRNAPIKSFTIYIEDFSTLSEHPSTVDFYKLFIECMLNSIMLHSLELKKEINNLSKEDKLFLSQLIVNYMKATTKEELNERIEKIQLSPLKRGINKSAEIIRLIANYGFSTAVKLFNSIYASQFSLPLIENKNVLDIVPDIKTKVDVSFNTIEENFSLLKKISGLIKKLGYNSVVILVDKIDEDSRFTNDGELISLFIKPLLTDNKLLLSNDLQIAVSLWSIPFDNLKSDIRTQKFYCPMLQWRHNDLIRAFDQRVKVYSINEEKFRHFRDFFAEDVNSEDINQLLVLSNNNPRDLWHIFNTLIQKQYSMNPEIFLITKDAVTAGLAEFVMKFNYYEYYPRKRNSRKDSMDVYRYIYHLLKLDDTEFTANQLNSSAGTGSSTNNYISGMQAMGLVVRTDSKRGGGIVYRINDPKVIYALQMGLRISRN